MTAFRFDRYAKPDLDRLAEQFRTAEPFPHVVFDKIIDGDAESLARSFPPPEWDGWSRFRDEYQRGKMFCQHIEQIPPPFASMLRELSEPDFLSLLERVTGIPALLPDPYLEGGGLHCSGAGGVLAPHTDFHIYTRLNLYRQVNVLVYLNPSWNEADGGCLELYRKGLDEPELTIVPRFGRCVIFRTDDRSVHGFSKPITHVDQYRKSLALYYYTSTESVDYAGDTTTYWQHHGPHQGSRRARLRVYQGLLFGSRAMASLAHRINPNLGRRREPK